MALYKYHYIELDTKRSPRVSLQNIVAGETGNRIWITLTNNGETVDLSEQSNDEFIYRVCLRVDSALGARRQDSAVTGSGITFITDNTGDHGKCNIRLSKDSFTAGLNRCRLEIYSKQWQENDTLICSAEFQFTAAGNPTGENAGNVYPSLIALENELATLKTETTAAKDAANTAASTANTAATNANNKATLAEQAAIGAENAATYAEGAASLAEDATNDANAAASSATTAATEAENAATRAEIRADAAEIAAANAAAATTLAEDAAADANDAATAANTAAAAANAAAATASAITQSFYVVPLTNDVLMQGEIQGGSIAITKAELEAKMNTARLAVAIYDPDAAKAVTLYEKHRDDSDIIRLQSSVDGDSEMYYVAWIDFSGNGTPTFEASTAYTHVPRHVRIVNGVVSFTNSRNLEEFSFTLPLYNGGVS